MADLPHESPWWTQTETELFASLHASHEGLTQEHAERRLKEYGRNELVSRKKVTLWMRFLGKCGNPLILLLFAAAGISGILGQLTDFVIILAILLVSITLDAYQEHEAAEGAEKLRKRVSITATVLRDSVIHEVPLSRLVPGDIILLSVGDIVPADCRVFAAKELLVDQSTLTGESYPQAKNPDAAVAANAVVSDRVNCVFMGTNVVSGEGRAIVVSTGSRTEIGAVAVSLAAPRPQTQFEKGINGFGLLLGKTAMIVSGIVFLTHLVLGHDVLSSMLFVLALAIGFAPELLPVILTINLSKGAMRMAKHGVIVKSLPSIENFGSLEILATDKTGTLTENAISLVSAIDPFGKDSDDVFFAAYLNSKFQSGFKGPMEEALLEHRYEDVTGYHYISTIPFDFFRKRVSTLFLHNKKRVLISKGAPEELLHLSTHVVSGGKIVPLTPAIRSKVQKQYEVLGRQGLRILAIARKDIRELHDLHPHDERGFTFAGFVTFADPAKSTAIESLKLIMGAGIEVKVLTGDSELVTEKICSDLNLPVRGIVTGVDIDRLTEAELGITAVNTTIFARLNPTQKERILLSLKKAGRVVGYLGDGINDAPSFRAADIGISVNNAADVAKDSADIILLHKSLRVLYDGVIEGRKTFGNVMKYLNMGMSSNFGNMLSIAVSSLFLPFLPLLPIQVLLNDLFYDASQLFLAGDSVDPQYVKQPKKWSIADIKKFMLVFGPVSSLFDFITFGILLWYFKANAPLFQSGWFLESLVTQTAIVLSIRTQLVPFYRSHMSTVFAAGIFGIITVALIIPFTPVGPLFSFVVPPLTYYYLLAGIVVSYIVIVELLKLWFYSLTAK